jgi:hypothetical protein
MNVYLLTVHHPNQDMDGFFDELERSIHLTFEHALASLQEGEDAPFKFCEPESDEFARHGMLLYDPEDTWFYDSLKSEGAYAEIESFEVLDDESDSRGSTSGAASPSSILPVDPVGALGGGGVRCVESGPVA